MRRCWSVFIFLFLCPKALFSQQASWSDSTWSSEILAGKDSIRINPEYLKAIEEGTLINQGPPFGSESLDLPILKDFSEYIKPDVVRRPLEFDSILPAVFLLYPIDSVDLYIRETAYKPTRSLLIRDRVRLGKLPLYGKVGAQNLFLPEVKDGQRRGSVGATLSLDFSLEHTLRSIFWQSERDKKRNKKRDFTWKHYNSYP